MLRSITFGCARPRLPLCRQNIFHPGKFIGYWSSFSLDLHFENCLLKKSKSWNPWSQEGWAVFCAVLSVTDCFPPFQSTRAWWQSLRNAGNRQKTRAGHSGCQTEQSLAMSESARHTSDKIMLEHRESIPWPLILCLHSCLGTWVHLIGGVHSPVVKICCQICKLLEV